LCKLWMLLKMLVLSKLVKMSESIGSRVMAPPRKSPYVGDRLLTVGEVAALMRVSSMTVYRLIKSGSLAAIRVGKNYRIRESDVNRYLSDRAVRVEHNG
jgi:excisionase family DNA binding protein